MAIDVEQVVGSHFPENAFYCERIGIEKVFVGEERGPFLQLIKDLKPGDPLAAHLACTPTLIVMKRSFTTTIDEASIFVRLFDGPISLEPWERDVYEKWYPTNRTVLYAPNIPEHVWLKSFLEDQKTVRSKFMW